MTFVLTLYGNECKMMILQYMGMTTRFKVDPFTKIPVC